MGRYEAPGRCPDCHNYMGGSPVCTVCGLPMVGREVERLRRLLSEADQVLAGIRLAAPAPRFGTPPVSIGAPAKVQPWPPSYPGAPVAAANSGKTPANLYSAAPPPPSSRTFPALSTAVILLLLGALSVLAAAFVFVTVSWSDLSLAAKAAILLGVTAVIFAVGWWCLRAKLRGGTETFAGLFAVMVTLDFLAAWSGGLFGLDGLSDDTAWWIAASLLVVASASWARSGVRTFGALTVVQLLAVVGLAWLSALALSDVPGRLEYVALLVAAVLVAALLVMAREALWTMAFWTLGLVGLLLVISFVSVVLELDDDATMALLWRSGDAIGVIVWIAMFAGAAAFTVVPMVVRIGLATSASLGVLLLVLRPIEDSASNPMLAAFAACAVVTAYIPVLLRRVPAPWSQGLSFAAAVPTLIAASEASYATLPGFSRVGESLNKAWELSPGQHLPYAADVTSEQIAAVPAPWLLGLALVAVGLAIIAIVFRRLPQPAELTTIGAIAAASTIVSLDLPLWAYVAGLATVTVVTAGVTVWCRVRWLEGVLVAAAAVTSMFAAGAPETTLPVAIGVMAMLVWWSSRTEKTETSAALAGAAVVAGGTAVASAVRLLSIDTAAIGDVLAGVGAATILAAQLRTAGKLLRQRVGVELGGVVVAVAGVAVASDDVDWALPIALTILGTSLSLTALWRTDRRMLGYAGGAVLVLATWVRLVVQDVSMVEAYTVPAALALLAQGIYRMYHSEGSSLTLLGPGLSLALLPSLLVAVQDPTSPRALALGVVAVCVVLVGAAEKWAAPMLFGGGVAATLILVNLAPYTHAIPRWVLFAGMGAVLLYLGITWEHRLRNLRSLALSLERVR